MVSQLIFRHRFLNEVQSQSNGEHLQFFCRAMLPFEFTEISHVSLLSYTISSQKHEGVP